MSNQHLAMRFSAPLTSEDSNIWAQLPSHFQAHGREFLADVLAMNSRSRVAAPPAYKELIFMRVRLMFAQGAMHRADFNR